MSDRRNAELFYNKSGDENICFDIIVYLNKITGAKRSKQSDSLAFVQINRRAKELNLTLNEYKLYFTKNKKDETQALIPRITVHHTFFFREYNQFLELESRLPSMLSEVKAKGRKILKIWCAASSTGEEVYSLAQFLEYHIPLLDSTMDYEILGSDICEKSIDRAKNGVYLWEHVKKAPETYREKNWIRGTGAIVKYAKICEKIKQKCKFKVLNLVEDDFNFLKDDVDHIFCRNVFIYFNEENIKKVIKKFENILTKNSLLFLGISENINKINGDFTHQGNSVYVLNGEKVKRRIKKNLFKKVNKELTRVLCVDDSSVVHKILDKILTEEFGFQIVGKARNGQEALKFLSQNKVDVITLDVNMPILDGPGFLKNYNQNDKAPVVMLTALNQDEVDLAKNCLSLGAIDYVQKPQLNDFAASADEIRFKLNRSIRFSKKRVGIKRSDRKKKVLVVDDSAVIRKLLKKIINKSEAFEVIADIGDSTQVNSFIKKYKPDVMVLDLIMPKANGVEVLKNIPQNHYVPSLIFSSLNKSEGDLVLDALSNGAVDYLKKPHMSRHFLKSFEKEFFEKLMVTAHFKKEKAKMSLKVKNVVSSKCDNTIIAIGSSTGGTEALKSIFTCLPENIPPIVVAQHIPEYFSNSLAESLNRQSPFVVKEGVHGEEVIENHVYIAPGGLQMEVVEVNGKKRLRIFKGDSKLNFFPSADILLSSVAKLKNVEKVGVILTGMGKDGSIGLGEILKSGGKTIAQDRKSCVVFGMPKAAIESGNAKKVLPLSEIPTELVLCYSSVLNKAS